MPLPEHLTRLRQAIADASQRLKQPVRPKDLLDGPTPGDLYVFDLAVPAAIEWLVVRAHPDEATLLLLAPADDFFLVGSADVTVTCDRPLAVRCGEAVWVPGELCPPRLWVGSLTAAALTKVRQRLAELARGTLTGGATDEDDDPEYVGWMSAVARARTALGQRRAPTSAGTTEIIPLERFTLTPHPAFAAEVEIPLAASTGGPLIRAVTDELMAAGPRYFERPLADAGTVAVAAEPLGLRLAWKGPPDTPPPVLTSTGPSGAVSVEWEPAAPNGFRHASAALPWLDGEVHVQVVGRPDHSFAVRL